MQPAAIKLHERERDRDSFAPSVFPLGEICLLNTVFGFEVHEMNRVKSNTFPLIIMNYIQHEQKYPSPVM